MIAWIIIGVCVVVGVTVLFYVWVKLGTVAVLRARQQFEDFTKKRKEP
jgi:hypothetical protein